jgi:hypothetical protein
MLMANKKIKSESYGTQRQTWAGGAGAGSNFQHGKDLGAHTRGSLGTRGADSNWSRASQAVMPLNAFTHFLDEDEEEFDEDYVVENSNYSLAESTGLFEQVLDAEPENNENIFIINSEDFDPASLARSEKTANELGLDISGDAIGTLISYVPGAAEASAISRIIKNLIELNRSSTKIIELNKKFEKQIKDFTNNDLLKRREFYIKLFANGIKDIEKSQTEIYTDLGDLAKAVVELFPSEYITTAFAAPTTPLGQTITYLITKFFEIALAGGTGKLTETFVRSFTESFEEKEIEDLEILDDDASLRRWLGRQDDSESKFLKILIFMLRILEGPFSNITRFGAPNVIVTRSIRALLIGAKMQNVLIKKIRLLQNPSLIDPAEEEFDSNIMADRESEEISQSSSDEMPSAAPNQFLRKLFFKDPGDSRMFAECLEQKSLLYLIEEKDSELDENLEEDEINEFSGAGGGAVAIGTLPLGMSTKGPGKKTSATSGGTAFPYNKKSRSAFKKYTKKTFGGTK